MQRKPRKNKVLLETAVATKMTDVLDVLAKCEIHNQNIEGFTASPSPFNDSVDLYIKLEGVGGFISTVPFFQGKEFVKAVSSLVPKHVIVQYYS